MQLVCNNLSISKMQCLNAIKLHQTDFCYSILVISTIPSHKMIFSKLSQTFVLLFSCVLLLGSLSQAAEETKYVASMSGVECTACKKTIAQAISKLGGVKTIRIIKKSKKSHQLEIYTDGSNELTKEDAVKALAKAKHYKILSWTKA